MDELVWWKCTDCVELFVTRLVYSDDIVCPHCGDGDSVRSEETPEEYEEPPAVKLHAKKNEVRRLEQKVDELRDKVKNLKDSNRSKDRSIGVLQTQNDELEADNEELRRQLSGIDELSPWRADCQCGRKVYGEGRSEQCRCGVVHVHNGEEVIGA